VHCFWRSSQVTSTCPGKNNAWSTSQIIYEGRHSHFLQCAVPRPTFRTWDGT